MLLVSGLFLTSVYVNLSYIVFETLLEIMFVLFWLINNFVEINVFFIRNFKGLEKYYDRLAVFVKLYLGKYNCGMYFQKQWMNVNSFFSFFNTFFVTLFSLNFTFMYF